MVRLAGVGGAWRSQLGFKIGGTDYMTHRGTYRIWARVYASVAATELRIAWAVNALDNYTYEPPARFETGQFYLVDLGVVRLQESPVGDHRWDAVIQARNLEETATVDIDRIELMPVEDGAKIQAPPGSASPFGGQLFRDLMEHSSGGLTGKTLAGIGTYAAYIDDGPDFQVNTVGDFVRRSGSDSYRAVGFAPPDVNVREVRASIKFRWAGYGAGFIPQASGLLLRVSGNQRISAYATFVPVGSVFQVILFGTEVGEGGSYFWQSAEPPAVALNEWHQLTVEAVEDTVHVYLNGVQMISAQHSGFGGAGAGGVYITDMGPQNSPADRDYTDFDVDNLAGSGTIPTALIHPDRSVELTSQGCWRESSDGDHWDKVTAYGALPRLPVSGAENREIEVFCRTSSGNLDNAGDDGLRSPSAQIVYRPCWYSVPEE